MSSRDAALPAIAPSQRLDNAWHWFWNFLKIELAPYPGRAWVVGRMTIAATIVMLLVMTFRLPSGFLAAIFTLFISRENPTVTMRAGVRTALSGTAGAIYVLAGVMTMIADPLTHFLWIAISLFLAFYLIRIVADYFTAVVFGFVLAGAIPLWDQTTLTINARTENTLWLVFAVLVGATVTVAVEYIFRRVHPATDLTTGIEVRLQSVEGLLRQIADGEQAFQFKKEIALYSELGTSRLRRILLRSGYPTRLIAQMNAAVALLGRLINLSASLQIVRSTRFFVPSPPDRERCLALAEKLARLQRDLKQQQLPTPIDIPSQAEPSELPLLPEMERTAALISQAFSGSGNTTDVAVPALVGEERAPLFVPDAFTNPAHIEFAMRGGLAALTAYVIYTAIDWPGLSTALATCIITALSTIGASRQKQFLRLSGALIGGIIFGMGAQVFVLPYLNSIVGFSVLFMVTTAISAWIATATPRLSYLGLQLALAFYLINLQEFTIQTSLAIARDRVFGILLGLVSMWVIFDRLWGRDALQEMEDAFSRNLQMLAEMIETPLTENSATVTERLLSLREQINNGFNTVKSQSDAVLFEFGPQRQRKLQVRDAFRRWQPTLGSLLQVEVTYAQYLLDIRSVTLPEGVAEAGMAFRKDMGSVLRALADEIRRKPVRPVPEVQESAARLRETIQQHFGTPIPSRPADMITLTQNLASILAPLNADIRAESAMFCKP